MTDNIINEVMQLRAQGLSDNLVISELTKRYPPEQVEMAISQADAYSQPMPGTGQGMPPGMPGMPSMSQGMPNMPGMQSMPSPAGFGFGGVPQPEASPGLDSNIYDRIEEITEGIIDEKWDELIAEVKKVVEWKEKVEEKQAGLLADVQKLKEDFKVLHQGVLGKLEDYDARMRDVGTELKAVGKVFKDVIPEFVENVKELKEIKLKEMNKKS